jgi:hypothetical protein
MVSAPGRRILEANRTQEATMTTDTIDTASCPSVFDAGLPTIAYELVRTVLRDPPFITAHGLGLDVQGITSRRGCTPILDEGGAGDGDTVLQNLALGVAHPPAVADQRYLRRRRHSACGPEEIDRKPGGHELRQTETGFQRTGGEPGQHGPVEVILTPVTLREPRRGESVIVESGEVRGTCGHRGIVAPTARVLHAVGPDAVFVPGHGAVVDAAFVRRQAQWLRACPDRRQ